MLADIRPNEDRAKMFVVTTTKSTGVQAGPVMSEHEVSRHYVSTTCDSGPRSPLEVLVPECGMSPSLMRTPAKKDSI